MSILNEDGGINYSINVFRYETTEAIQNDLKALKQHGSRDVTQYCANKHLEQRLLERYQQLRKQGK